MSRRNMHVAPGSTRSLRSFPVLHLQSTRSDSSGSVTSTYKSTTPFRLAWLALFGLHCLMSTYLLFVALAYWLMSMPQLEFIREIYDLPPPTFLRWVAFVFLLLAIAFIIPLWRMLYASLCMKRLMFFRIPVGDKAPAPSSDNSIYARISAIMWSCGNFFARFCTLRHLLSILSLSYQGYWLSFRSPSVLMNVISTVLLVLKCWCPPILQVLLHDPDRMMHMSVNLVVDFMTCIMIRFLIVLRYWGAYDPSRLYWKDDVIGDSAFFVGFEMELGIVCARSTLDFIMTVIPLLGMLVWSYSLSHSLHQRAAVATVNQSAGPSSQLVIVRNTRQSHWLYNLVLLLWGLMIVVLQILAMQTARGIDAMGCLVPIRPWFVTRHSCAMVLANCYTFESNESEALVDHWSRFNAHDVIALEIRHCPALEMPAALQDLPMLGSIIVFNSTIIKWDQEAAITASTHPKLRVLLILQTNMSTIPTGWLMGLPPTLRSMTLGGTNLSTLPQAIATQWKHLKYLSLDHGSLQEIPSVLWDMPQLDILDITGNQIESWAMTEHPQPSLVYLRIGENPINELPDDIGDSSQLVWLTFDHTNITTIPQWVQQLPSSTIIYGTGSPYCANATLVKNGTSRIECDARNPQANLYDPFVQKKTLQLG